jgi:hypothetical protein
MLQLRHLSVPELIAAAGGDPWRLNNTIQSGSPGQINELAAAFYQAGVCMGDTSDEFNQAKKRFDAAWDRDDPALLNREQMSRVAVDLQNMSASLAEAQRSGRISVGNLEARLQQIDSVIDAEIQKARADGVFVDWSELKRAAIESTKRALQEVQSVRDAYADQLDTARVEMAGQGYSPDATEGVDGEGGLTPAEQAHADVENAGQRAADQALVDSAGPEAIRYAGERLNDFDMSRFVGPLPTDPILGNNARDRARFRQEWQQKLEQGLLDAPPMSPDAGTEMLDRADAQSRMLARTESGCESGIVGRGHCKAGRQSRVGRRYGRHRRRAIRGLGSHREACTGRPFQSGR